MARCAARDSTTPLHWVFVVSMSEHRHLACVTPCISHVLHKTAYSKQDWLRNLSQTGAVWWRVCECVCVCWWSQIEDLITIISKQTRRMKKIGIAWIICLIKQYHFQCLDMRLDLTQHVMHVGTLQNTFRLSKYLQFYRACDINATLAF